MAMELDHQPTEGPKTTDRSNRQYMDGRIAAAERERKRKKFVGASQDPDLTRIFGLRKYEVARAKTV